MIVVVAKTKPGHAIRRARRRGAQLRQLDEFILDAQLRNDLGEWRRGRAVRAYIDGRRVTEIASEAGVTRGSVNRWLQWYDADHVDGLRTSVSDGPAPKLNEAQQAQLADIIEQGPIVAGYHSGVWTGPMIGNLIEQRFGVVVIANIELRVLVRASFEQSRRTYGSIRIHQDLVEAGEHIGRNRVIRIMQEDGMRARPRKRSKCTTMSDHDQPIAPNVLARRLEAAAPNQRWVGDTTEMLTTSGGKFYLAAVIDLCSRYCVGWAVSAVNDRHVTMRALEMAVRRRCPDAGLLHHSDQGSTYASEDYQDLLAENGITCSMSRRGNCLDNAAMESWFSTVKFELGETFESIHLGKEQLFDYIEVFYNQQRRHSSIDYVSPARYEREQQAELQLAA
jgi:transposase InsO family protein